ncbi:MAG: fibrillarin-like rRNA/tRNA 2'-O-methyltransferase [Methanomassiliicoccaceae archaeon]|jgi:fibrillarin-like pre-rRNA processing protein|nr:fibrillarin-like rRNA/tRNA 2'-O-methyltransferase [Methanomassiliicoccaceae archaeon]
MMMAQNERIMFRDGRLMTLSAYPGNRVYGERLVNIDGNEYREWSPNRSKLSAYICLGGSHLPFTGSSNVLYLGAASGTTASHVSDIVNEGTVYCIEFSQRSFRDLVVTCEMRKNMIPILGDATRPESYSFALGNVDVVYQDVAQKGQADIFADNMECFSARYGMVSIKARSEDVTASPEKIFDKACERLAERGMTVIDIVSLEKYEKAHMMIVVERVI